MHHPIDRIAHTTAFVEYTSCGTPVGLENEGLLLMMEMATQEMVPLRGSLIEIAQRVHHEGLIRRPIAP